MPMVPNFQGNLPQVSDTTTSGAVPVQIPQSNFSYERVMQRAMQPINAAADTAIKMMEIERNRVIKAESDDAERQVMEAINTAMNDPDTGYMTKQGRNAMDAYKPTMDDLTRNVNKIVGGLSPQAREAVRSRIDDRMMTATNQARRWNASQTRHYQMQSSSSKVEALQEDAANHYADPEYLAKSAASVDMELDYQAQLMGWDAETLANQKRAHMDQLQAKRFTAWAQDDPVSAFEALRSAPKGSISPDIRRKLDDSLWRQSKGLLASELAAKHPLTGDKNDLWRAIQSEKTGIPLIDGLSQAHRAELFTSVWTKQKEAQSELRQYLSLKEKNSLAVIGETGADADMLSLDQYVEVYGESDGQKRYDTYKSNAETTAAMHGFRNMPIDAMNAVIDAAAPVRGSDDYADQVKRRDSLIKARNEVTKMRKADPVAYAISAGAYGAKGIDFKDASSIFGQVAVRAQSMKELAKDYGIDEKIFSTTELSQLKAHLDSLDAREKVLYLGHIADVAGENGVGVIRRQLGEERATGFLLCADPSLRASGTAENYYLGKAGIAEKQMKVGIVTSASTGIPLMAEKLNGLIDNTDVRDRVIDSLTAVAAGKVMNGESPGEAMDQAMREIVGDIQEYNGYKVALKDGVLLSELEDAVRSNVRSYERYKGVVAKLPDGTQLTGQQVAKLLPTARLKLSTTGIDNDFDVILSNGQKLIHADGSPFTIRAVSFK